ncbi:hypothetical protein, partial [Faecalispora jeddahensis]|uniref:hypothetical protein n=1 Tax=Faecalispora jeddahensis TaxID=1414721 RepID=UPI001A9C234B
QSGAVPKTDSKGVLWKAFAYFRPFTKVSARPGMRGKPAPAEAPRGAPVEKICSLNANYKNKSSALARRSQLAYNPTVKAEKP